MVPEGPCQGCKEQQDCRKVWARLSGTQTPPVAVKAMIAFVLPVLTFVICLAGLDEPLKSTALGEGPRVLVAFGLALAATLLLMTAVRLIARLSGGR